MPKKSRRIKKTGFDNLIFNFIRAFFFNKCLHPKVEYRIWSGSESYAFGERRAFESIVLLSYLKIYWRLKSNRLNWHWTHNEQWAEISYLHKKHYILQVASNFIISSSFNGVVLLIENKLKLIEIKIRLLSCFLSENTCRMLMSTNWEEFRRFLKRFFFAESVCTLPV